MWRRDIPEMKKKREEQTNNKSPIKGLKTIKRY